MEKYHVGWLILAIFVLTPLLFFLVNFTEEDARAVLEEDSMAEALIVRALPGLSPFGGQISSIFQCLNGLKIEVGPPAGGTFMYIPGASFSYAYGSPSHPGQWLLGMHGGPRPCLVPTSSGVGVNGFGDLIVFHGSSR